MTFVPRARAMALWVLAALLVAPAAQAGMIERYAFTFEVGPVAFGGDGANGGSVGLSLITGRLDAQGERGGLYGFVNIQEGAILDADRIEVINAADQRGAIGRATRGECNDPQSCAIERTFVNGTAQVLPGGNLLVYADAEPVNYTVRSRFALATLFTPPSDLGGDAAENLSFEQSILAIGSGTDSALRVPTPSVEVYAFLPDANSTFAISEGGAETRYTGKEFLFRFHGTPRATFTSRAAVFPFAGAAQASLLPGASDDVKERFQLEAANDVFKTFGSTQTVIDATVAKQFRQIAPILNGVFVGNATNPEVNGDRVDNSSFSVVRFSGLGLRPAASGATVSGHSSFVLFEDGFYTAREGVKLGAFFIPALSWILWIVAAGAIVAGFVLKPALAPKQVSGFGTVRLAAFLFHLAALVLAIILWDQEVKAFLGTSLITLFSEGAFGQQVAFGVTAFFQLVPFFLALILFGMPVRFIVNSALKLGGLKKARGIGKGLGDLAVWGIGTAFIPLLINGLLGAVMNVFRGLLS